VLLRYFAERLSRKIPVPIISQPFSHTKCHVLLQGTDETTIAPSVSTANSSLSTSRSPGARAYNFPRNIVDRAALIVCDGRGGRWAAASRRPISLLVERDTRIIHGFRFYNALKCANLKRLREARKIKIQRVFCSLEVP